MDVFDFLIKNADQSMNKIAKDSGTTRQTLQRLKKAPKMPRCLKELFSLLASVPTDIALEAIQRGHAEANGRRGKKK